MKPDARKYNPDPRYLRQLVDQVRDPELQDTVHQPPRPSQRKIAQRLGISDRALRNYLSEDSSEKRAPYAVQFCLEVLAKGK